MSVYGGEKQPTTWFAKILFKAIGLYAVFSTFSSGLSAFLAVLADKGDTMIYTAENWILYLGMALGILFCLILGYFFKFQVYQKDHPDKLVKFEVKYVIAAFCTLLVSAIVSYVIVMYGLGYIAPETEITQASIAFLMAFAIGGFATFVIDACIFHPVVDGSAAMAFNKAQAKIREELASKEAQEALMAAIGKKASDLGLVSEKKIAALQGMVKGVDDPNFALYVQMLINTPEQ